MFTLRSFAPLVAALSCAVVFAPQAFGHIILKPNGDPAGGPHTAHSPPINGVVYQVTVPPAIPMLPWPEGGSLETVLATQGFSAANGWTIDRFHLQGNYSLHTNYAVAGASAGANFRIDYLPHGTDPAGAGVVHWIQIISTNAPAAGAINPISFVSHPAASYYIDNVGNPPNNPFYDALPGYADHTYLADSPRRPYATDTFWRAFTFVATGDLAAKRLSIAEEGVYWGFDDPPVAVVPEPTTLALFAIGSLGLFAARMRREGRRVGSALRAADGDRLAGR